MNNTRFFLFFESCRIRLTTEDEDSKLTALFLESCLVLVVWMHAADLILLQLLNANPRAIRYLPDGCVDIKVPPCLTGAAINITDTQVSRS